MRDRNVLIVSSLLSIALLILVPSRAFSSPQLVIEVIEIQAPTKYVFEAIQIERDVPELKRHLTYYDGRVAKIDEYLENIPIYGKVHCIWEETEFPFEKVDYKMLQSDKFKSAFGTWLLFPSANNLSTRLELKNFIDANLHVPFADLITRHGTSKNTRERLVRIKRIAEAHYIKDMSLAVRR